MNRDLTYLLDLEKTCKTILELVEGMSKESFLIDRRGRRGAGTTDQSPSPRIGRGI
jgi:hypothetical protein